MLAKQNRQAIAESGHLIVYLRAEPDVLHRRISADPATAENRPGLTHLGGSVEEIRTLLAEREPIYQQLKSIELNVNSSNVEPLVEQLLKLLNVAAKEVTTGH